MSGGYKRRRSVCRYVDEVLSGIGGGLAVRSTIGGATQESAGGATVSGTAAGSALVE